MGTWRLVIIGLTLVYWVGCRFVLPYRRTIRLEHFGTRDVSKIVLVLPGFNNPARIVAQALAERQPHLHYVAVEMPTRWRSSQQIVADLLRFGHNNHSKQWRIYGGSMGGRIAAELLAAQGTTFTPQNTRLLMDCTPASIGTIRMPGIAMKLCRYWHGGPVSRPLYAIGVVVMRLLKPWPTNTPDGNRQLIRRLHIALHFPSTVAMTSQAAYLGRFDPRTFAEKGLDRYQVTYVYGPGRDPLVDVHRSISEWKVFFPNLNEAQDPTRKDGEHACATERPAWIAAQLATL